MKRVLICGIDGYIGWTLAVELLKSGNYLVCGIDNFSRRRLAQSLTPITEASTRERWLTNNDNYIDRIAGINLHNYYLLERVLDTYEPNVIVNLAEQPSAPWSMHSPRNALETQHDNVLGNLSLLWAMRSKCPDAHLVKLGTMGEYGQPNCDIPEGEIPNQPCSWLKWIEDQNDSSIIKLKPKCPMSGLPFPRKPGSFYHLSKVHDTYNIKFACDTWGLRSTDIMQGVVFGLNEDQDQLITRFDYDEFFGTVINRFCVQALIEHPLTVYGEGGMIRSFLPLKDSIQCLRLAIDNPPEEGEYRTFNQFGSIHSIRALAHMVVKASKELSLEVQVDLIDNPRNEIENHYYNPVRKHLADLGYEPTRDIEGEIRNLILSLMPFKSKINKHCIMPTVYWR